MVAAERALCREQTLDTLIQQLINGVMLGSIYALIALGYTMVYGILRIINFAHGDILMVGALTTLSAINALNATFPHCRCCCSLALPC
jgi:branched-chain amino acid transport system permease protein